MFVVFPIGIRHRYLIHIGQHRGNKRIRRRTSCHYEDFGQYSYCRLNKNKILSQKMMSEDSSYDQLNHVNIFVLNVLFGGQRYPGYPISDGYDNIPVSR